MKSIGMACTAVALLALTGCESTTRIEARDQSAFLPNLKASFNFGKGVDAPSRPQSGHSIEVEATRGKGSDSQTLAATDSPLAMQVASPQSREPRIARTRDATQRIRRKP